MKITVRATQREKLFHMHEDLVTKRSEYSKDLFVRPYSGRTYESLFTGPKSCAQLLLGKGKSCVFVDAAPGTKRPQMGVSERLPWYQYYQ
jgi:hypothetical protein